MQDEGNGGTERQDAADSQEKALEAALRQAKKGEGSSRNKARRYFSQANNWIAVLTFVVLVTYTVVTGALWLAQIHANAINQRILTLQTESNGSAVYFGKGIFYSLPQPAGDTRIEVLIEMGNSGGTTTRDLNYRLTCIPSQGLLGEPFDRTALVKTDWHAIPLAPRQPPLTVEVCPIALSEFAFATVAKLSVYVFGEAVYKDTTFPGKTHHIEFCTRLHDFAIGLSIVARSDYCPRHNCADDECAAD